MRALVYLLGFITVICILAVLFSLVSPRLQDGGAPACGVGLVTGIAYLLLAARQSRVDRDAKDDARARKLADEIVRRRDRQ